ncbi:hypothetical protein KJ903_04965 [Patescibacteria group bacterium]|nr:hypothetical protein [Patescibacteria group bacterium]
MARFNLQFKRITQLGVAGLLILLLAAFGCKKSDEPIDTTTEETNTAVPTDEVTFTSPTDTNTATTDTNTTTDSTNTATDTNTSSTNTADTNSTTTSDANSTNTTDTTTTSTTSQTEKDILKLAETLAEIYGTFTNKDKQSYKNLSDIKPYTSQKMSAWIDNKTAGTTTSNSGGSFYGITTKALSSAVLDSSSTSYKVLVTCQREEITEVTKSPQKDFQLLEMYFVQESKDWKLDSAFWK